MSSTNDTRSGRPRRKGILRGLDSDNIIQPTTTQRSVELGDEGSDEEGSSPIMDHRYATRTVESGRSSKIRDQYDMKYVDRSNPPSSIVAHRLDTIHLMNTLVQKPQRSAAPGLAL